jgi:hypothetical protein
LSEKSRGTLNNFPPPDDDAPHSLSFLYRLSIQG